MNAENDGTVGVIDTAKGKMTSTISLGKPGEVKPMAVLMAPDGSKLFVSTGRGQAGIHHRYRRPIRWSAPWKSGSGPGGSRSRPTRKTLYSPTDLRTTSR